MCSLDYFQDYLKENCLVLKGMRNGNFLVANFKENFVSITNITSADDTYSLYNSSSVGNFLGFSDNDCISTYRFYNTSVYFKDKDSLVFSSIIRKNYQKRAVYCVRFAHLYKNKKFYVEDKIIIEIEGKTPKFVIDGNKLVDYCLKDISGSSVGIEFSLEDKRGIFLSCNLRIFSNSEILIDKKYYDDLPF